MNDSRWVSTSTPYLAPPGEGQPEIWGAEAAARGRRGSQRVVEAGEVAAPGEVADLMGVAVGEPVIVRRRVMYLDGDPCELTDTYYPVGIARGTRLAEAARIPGGAIALLAQLGYAGARVKEEVTARMPDPTTREALGTGPREPVLLLRRLTLDRAGRPIQVDVMTMPAHRQRLRYEIEIG
ncbi:transcriptional regulator [Wenjunlia vitaminophila]|uniref:Transcriptional regulator n=1 Tax=Wenjunlia vitaminophila TaxID=76728 RepID=A0A0T6LPA8_WENVI|nr:UTRA domain-containing protein [Wenjunlia vitaminophila]KRV47730.1 transcriptional regulator [Wenjunlia vitaminophila]